MSAGTPAASSSRSFICRWVELRGEAAGPGVGHVGGDGPQAQVLHEGLRRRPAPLHGEAHHAAGAVGRYFSARAW